MKRSFSALVSAVALTLTALASAGDAQAQTPDIDELIATIEEDALYAHIDAIDEPRNAFAQPERLAEAGDYLQSSLEASGYEVGREDVTARGVTSQNIYAELEGTSCPERMFVVGAHYDSVEASPGADDNATGTAAMLEIARALADTPLPATVRFAGFTMEEDGLIGSFVMAGNLSGANAEVVGMISYDMAGYTAGPGNDFLAIVGNTASVRLTDAVHRVNAAYLPDFPIAVLNLEGTGEEQPDSSRSDHFPFWQAGYQAFLATDTANFRNPNYHQPSDTIDTLDFGFVANSTKAMLATTVDYLTYDGDNDGEADACSGPLVATPTVTPAPTAAATDEPATTATPTATALPGLPVTGDKQTQPNDWSIAWALAGIIGAAALGGASIVLRTRR